MAELGLAGAITMAETNRMLLDILPRCHTRFAASAAETVSAYRPLDSELDLASVLCFKHKRKMARDTTVK